MVDTPKYGSACVLTTCGLQSSCAVKVCSINRSVDEPINRSVDSKLIPSVGHFLAPLIHIGLETVGLLGSWS